jgi:isopropylmalate/homocitrate/citramalate synthase
MPSPPEAADPRQNVPENANIRPSVRAVVQQHEKEFRDSLASLSERVSQLKEEIEQLHSADIFSVKIFKETSEIERLAKQLKTLAKS